MSRSVIAVTGATGFVGKATLCALRRRFPDSKLRVLVRNAGNRALPDELLGCTVIGGTLDTPDALISLVEGVDCVVHVAAAIRGSSAAEFERDNIQGTRNLIDVSAALAPDAHFVHISSLAARLPELSWYAASKRAAEEVVAANCRRFSILRPPAVYGPEDPALAMFWRMLARGWLIRAGSDDSRFSLLHVDDLAEAIVRLVEYGPSSKILTLSGPQPERGWRWADLAELGCKTNGRRVRMIALPGRVLYAGSAAGLMVSRIAGRAAMLSPGKARELLHSDWVCDNLEIKRCLNWTPTTQLERALDTLPGWSRQ